MKRLSSAVRPFTEEELSPGMQRVADNRIAPLFMHWAHRADSIPLQMLLRSCYLQGVRDMVQAEMQLAARASLDFSI